VKHPRQRIAGETKGATMKRLTAIALSLFASTAFAQFCDVTYTLDTDVVLAEGAEPVNTGTIVGVAYGLPLADAEDNTRLGKKIINEASKQQDKGGPYLAYYSEMRSCGGGPAVQADGIFVKGVTLNGSNKIGRVALQVGDEVTKRYEKRAQKGDRFAQDHQKARKIERDGDTKKRKRAAIVAGD
jgi:hypothetical protein